jgi:hypothetical protein
MQRNQLPDRLLIAAFGFLYLLLPTINPSLDAWGYAADIRWNGELWSAHHLLYNAWGRLWTLRYGTEDVMGMMQADNALFAAGTLWLLRGLLLRIQPAFTTAGILMAGAAFGFMRFAVENETYILPLFLGVLALSLDKQRKWHTELALVLALALAMLFHQSYIFWYLAFILYRLRITAWRSAIFPALALPLVAGVYWVVAYSKGLSLPAFVLHDVYDGGVATSLSWKNFLLTPVSFLRSFVQVHGYIAWSWQHDGMALRLLYVAFGIGLLWSGLRWLQSFSKPIKALHPLGFFALTAALLHLLFAFYSEGNAEFMVMLPLLGVLCLAVWNLVSPARTVVLSVFLLCWNLLTGIGPAHFRDFYGHNVLLSRLVNHPNTRLVSEEPVLLRNMLQYQLGVAWRSEQLVLESPTWAVGKGKSADSAVWAIRMAVRASRQVWYCDYSRYLFNRAKVTASSVTLSNDLEDFFQLEQVDSFRNMAGVQKIYRLTEQ